MRSSFEKGDLPPVLASKYTTVPDELRNLIAAFGFVKKRRNWSRQVSLQQSIQILDTDVSEVLAKARAGIYPESIAMEVSADQLRRFFTKPKRLSNFEVHQGQFIFARQNVGRSPLLETGSHQLPKTF